jgi:hypothetical protein
MFADFPPNSKVTLFKLFIAESEVMIWPTRLEPVNEILSINGCSTNAYPAYGPYPGTTFITPFGNPALKN